MDINKFLETVLHEWSYRLPDGTPDINNPAHLLTLKEVLSEMNLPEEFVEQYLENIRSHGDETYASHPGGVKIEDPEVLDALEDEEEEGDTNG